MKRAIVFLVLLLLGRYCFGQVNYVLYRSSSNTNAYNNHGLYLCSATSTFSPFNLEWSIADGTGLVNKNTTLTGYYNSPARRSL